MEIIKEPNVHTSGSCRDAPISCCFSKEAIIIESLPKLNDSLLKFNSDCFNIDTRISASVRRLRDGRL